METRKKIDVMALRKEYGCGEQMFSEDDTRMWRIKRIINNELEEPERIIFTAYADMHSSRKLGRILGVSHTTIAKEVNRIRKKIIERMSRCS